MYLYAYLSSSFGFYNHLFFLNLPQDEVQDKIVSSCMPSHCTKNRSESSRWPLWYAIYRMPSKQQKDAVSLHSLIKTFDRHPRVEPMGIKTIGIKAPNRAILCVCMHACVYVCASMHVCVCACVYVFTHESLLKDQPDIRIHCYPKTGIWNYS